MRYKKELGMALIIAGIFLIIIQPFSMTGAVIDISTTASRISFIIGLGLIVGGIVLFMTKRIKGLGKVVNEAEALLKQGKILTNYNDLMRLGERMDYQIKPGGSHFKVYKGGGFVTTIPKDRSINRNTARGIMTKYRDNV